MRVRPRDVGFERCLDLEWVLANGLGGYSSSTVLELNTRKYHGLLVAALEKLNRVVCLSKIEDSFETAGKRTELNCIEFGGGVVHAPGFESLTEFEKGPDYVHFRHETLDFGLEKRVWMIPQRNAVAVAYRAENKTGRNLKHRITPLVTHRSIHELSTESSLRFESKTLKESAEFTACGRKLTFTASRGNFGGESICMRNVHYPKEAERGYQATEDLIVPFSLSVDVPGGRTRDYMLTISLGSAIQPHIKRARLEFDGSDLMNLLSAAGSFIVDAEGGKTVIAGYHWFGEWGRDAMISLPGLALIEGRLADARAILERFVGRMRGGRIMTESEGGAPAYRDYDSTLWLVDRTLQYVKYAGMREGESFLHSNFGAITEAMRYYKSISKKGLIVHQSGTWMDTLSRDNAVEVQALWYNALNAFEAMADFLGRKTGSLKTGTIIEEFESNFMDEYWNGKYLRDCEGDDSLRPNQLIALSLNYPCVGKKEAKKILNVAEKRLLTPFGLRTLDQKDRRYCGAYAGGVRERELSYHNGTVWPWFLGPYVSASVRYGGMGAARKAKKTLEGFFGRALKAGALGSISEVFDGDRPHTPRGCVSQAWSVAEPLRAYFEDAVGRRPPYESLFD